MKRNSSFPLRNVLAMQFIIIAVAPILLVTLFLFFLVIPQITEEKAYQNQLFAKHAQLLLDAEFKKHTSRLQNLNIQLKKVRKNTLSESDLSENHGFFDAVYLLAPKGQITLLSQQASSPSKDREIQALAQSVYQFFASTNQKKAFWFDMLNSPLTSLQSWSYVIPSQNKFLVGQISKDHLWEMLKKQNLPALTLLLGANNEILASNKDIRLISKNNLSLDSLIPLDKKGFYKLGEQKIQGEITALEGTPWSVFVGENTHWLVENSSLYAIFFMLLITTGLLFALLLSLYFSRSLSRQLLGYTKNIREIARGSYSAISAKSKIREIVHFAQNLQKMSATIREKEKGYNQAMTHYLEIIKAIENIVILIDPDLLITHINQSSKHIFGLEPEKCIGRSFLEFVPPQDIEKTKKRYMRWAEEGLESVTTENQVIDCHGQYHTITWSIDLNREENDHFTGYTCIGHEFSAWKTMQEELQLAALVYQKSGEAMVVISEDNLIISLNPAFETITGYSAEEVLLKNPAMLGSALHDNLFYESIWGSQNIFGNWQGEVWNMRKNGELYAIRLTVNTIESPDKKTYRRVALFSDITEQKLTEKITWQQNYFDSLTGLPNRNFLKQELSRAKKINLPIALMCLDLDGFKHINETFSHMTGDMLLQETAHRLQNCLTETDTIVRIGSDEFAILRRELTSPEQIKHIGKIILSKLSEPFFLNNAVIHISANIGVTFYPDDTTDIDDLLKNADQAMHAAKREGKNTLLYFTQSMQELAQARMQLINDLRQALAGHQFEIMYQPIVDIESGLIRKAEALIRWQHPTKGTINPVEFISIAEDTGMIASFGNWIFHQAASQASIWRNRFHPDFQISINISPVQFKNEGIDFINWMSHLKDLQLPGKGLVIEITEGLLLNPSEHVKQQLAAFKNAGMEIALDDFGVGYSSFSYLQDFNFDYIKIDQSFIKNLSQGSDNLALCEAMIVMAHKLNMNVIAEGIETIRQREILVESACDFGQGYLYSTPLPATEFEQILENNITLFHLNARTDVA